MEKPNLRSNLDFNGYNMIRAVFVVGITSSPPLVNTNIAPLFSILGCIFKVLDMSRYVNDIATRQLNPRRDKSWNKAKYNFPRENLRVSSYAA